MATNGEGTRRKEDKEEVISYLSPFSSLRLSHRFFFLLPRRRLVPSGSLGDIYSAMEGRRRRAHGVSFTITWKFPARSRIPWTLYPALALILAVPREKQSVTEQINVYCFLSRPDRPLLTAAAVILPAMLEYSMMLHHQRALQMCELHQ